MDKESGVQDIFMTIDSFKELGLSPQLINVLARSGISTPTEIQTRTIPSALKGRSLMASAETGSGKTLAFLLPIIERLKRPGAARALVLAPTRELAKQIDETAKTFGRVYGLRATSIVGGENVSRQIGALRNGSDIIVATPGRLNDLIERGAVRLKQIETLVLDEADRMLDMGFLPQVRRIFRHLPSDRQSLIFSATLSTEVEALARELLADCERIDVGQTATTVSTLSQKAFPVLSHAKAPMLLALLRQHAAGAFLVFTETKRGAEHVSRILTANKHEVVTLHSDRNQSQRNQALARFRSGSVRVLVATDVAARGIDVDDIAFVINYDVPATAEGYIHRVGRTARAGRNGAALTFVSPEEESTLAQIERITGTTMERGAVDGFTDGRSEEQIKLTSEIGLLRSSSARSFRRVRARL